MQRCCRRGADSLFASAFVLFVNIYHRARCLAGYSQGRTCSMVLQPCSWRTCSSSCKHQSRSCKSLKQTCRPRYVWLALLNCFIT